MVTFFNINSHSTLISSSGGAGKNSRGNHHRLQMHTNELKLVVTGPLFLFSSQFM